MQVTVRYKISLCSIIMLGDLWIAPENRYSEIEFEDIPGSFIICQESTVMLGIGNKPRNGLY